MSLEQNGNNSHVFLSGLKHRVELYIQRDHLGLAITGYPTKHGTYDTFHRDEITYPSGIYIPSVLVQSNKHDMRTYNEII